MNDLRIPRVPSGRLDGRAAIVTGATSGIGMATVRRLVAEGARVTFVGRSLGSGAALAREVGGAGLFVAADLTDDGAAERILDRAVSAFGSVDVLVNSAGIDHVDDLLTTPLATVRELFEVNFFTALRLIQVMVPQMPGAGSSIVNVTSRLASVGVAKMGLYGASKGALFSLTRAAAVELAPRGIRVNAVAPGMTRTSLFEAWVESQANPEQANRDVTAAIPQRRLAEPADVAATIAFLVSDDAAHITGVSIAVDGGYTAQ